MLVLLNFVTVFLNHHLPCPFPLLGTDRPRLTVADIRFRKRIDLDTSSCPINLYVLGKSATSVLSFRMTALSLV